MSMLPLRLSAPLTALAVLEYRIISGHQFMRETLASHDRQALGVYIATATTAHTIWVGLRDNQPSDTACDLATAENLRRLAARPAYTRGTVMEGADTMLLFIAQCLERGDYAAIAGLDANVEC